MKTQFLALATLSWAFATALPFDTTNTTTTNGPSNFSSSAATAPYPNPYYTGYSSFPSGIFPTGVFPTGVFPTGVFPTGVFPSGYPTMPNNTSKTAPPNATTPTETDYSPSAVVPTSTGVTCSPNGELVCNGLNEFGLCNWGRVAWQPVAPGTACVNGAITWASDYPHARWVDG
ncbi:hypothetical protein LTS02_003631 [Friedmanniomyces endolithicus]|nr:hypothetical protein LTR94_006182 [Friedmanniomyces endolithicus]KAK0780534.1 hypothetical protein LTR38_014057 [Friedmanniomyces endolithicus]KAK0788504.1 hypothetical protein LTR75_012576 [Friedmanniomyces endolithicus]KAK0796362.1 hypothetical protein LTR59_007115 [Friedmanniomyces endolithicus]KAK0868317.1 hypothetical protein LTS02_003631 [Friedmanniomyces endolithicus]